MTNTAATLSSKDSETESSIGFPSFRLTSETLHGKGTRDSTVDTVTLFLRGFRALPFLPPASDSAQMTSETCGPPQSSAYAWYDRATSSWKTHPDSTPPGTQGSSSVTWQKADIMLAGVCYRQPRWMRPICDIASGLWPTPTRVSASYTSRGAKDKYGSGMTLTEAVRRFPSPAYRDYRSGKGRKDNGHTPQVPEMVGGLLNPDWDELLMGWPMGWTSLRPMSIEAFLDWKERALTGRLWVGGEWERGIPRITTYAPDRRKRVSAIGNGQVPLAMATAWRLLFGD